MQQIADWLEKLGIAQHLAAITEDDAESNSRCQSSSVSPTSVATRDGSSARARSDAITSMLHLGTPPRAEPSAPRWSCIDEAMTAVETTKETWCEAELNCVAGEIARKSPEPDAVKAQTYFERALSVARQQQAKSWELRAAMSLARLWRDHDKPQQARELLAPVYGWFTEGFDTRDLKEAKALLEQLAI
jgi:hypothetical protein